MPRASRSASVIASSVDAYCQKRVPPSAGPSVVSWIAMIPKYPQLGSCDSRTCSWPSACIDARMSIEAPDGVDVVAAGLELALGDPAPRLRVAVESPATLPPQVPGGDHLPEQRRRPVLVVAQALVQHLENREAHVEADEVGQLQRAHRVGHAQL